MNKTLTPEQFHKLLTATADLPFIPAQREFGDYMTDVLLTVLDFHMQAPVVEDALDYFREHIQFKHVHTHQDLKDTLNRFPDTEDGNKQASRFLWNNQHWMRAALLRQFLLFLDAINVSDQPSLYAWAKQAQFVRDFKGKVKGLGIAVFHWLILRCGVETIKPDVWVINFGQRVVGQRISEEKLIKAFTDIAPLVGESLPTIDGTIWHFEKNAMGTTDSPALRIVWWYLLKRKLEAELDTVLAKNATWQLELDDKDRLRFSQAGLTITIRAVDTSMTTDTSVATDQSMTVNTAVTTDTTITLSVWILRQTVWHEGFELELLLRQEQPMEPALFDQLKARLEEDGWELENEPVFTATLDLETSLQLEPDTSLQDLADWADEISECFFDALAEFKTETPVEAICVKSSQPAS